MANKLLSEMGLPNSIANIFAARNLITAKDVLSLTEFELMELLDVDLAVVTSAVAHISEITCPLYQTALSLLEHRGQNENMAGHLPTSLKGLDNALCGGIPFGVVTELVGPAGIVLLEAFIISFSSFVLWRLRWFCNLYRYRIQI